jgi:hypothetical protein
MSPCPCSWKSRRPRNSHDLDERKLDLVCSWDTERTNVYSLAFHNVERSMAQHMSPFHLSQTYEHAGLPAGCPACQRLIRAHIEEELSLANPYIAQNAMPIGYSLKDGNLHTYRPGRV